jgi:hypothetical protein
VNKLVVVVLVLASARPAFAQEAQFGRWAIDQQHCSGSTKAGPLTVTVNSVSLASESCTIGKMYKADRGLYIEGRCSNGRRHPISLEMKGSHLLVTWNGEKSEMQRCP